MKHWTQNLSEGRRIYEDEVFYLNKLILKRDNLKSQVENVESEISAFEIDLLNSVKKQYTSVEIEDARAQFVN